MESIPVPNTRLFLGGEDQNGSPGSPEPSVGNFKPVVRRWLGDDSASSNTPSLSHVMGPQTCPPVTSPSNPPPPPVSRKRKRAPPPDPAVVESCGPILSDPGEETDQSTPDPPHTTKFTTRKNSACEIWAFTRAVKTAEDIPTEQWPSDYDSHLSTRPKSSFVGCKFCSQFG